MEARPGAEAMRIQIDAGIIDAMLNPAPPVLDRVWAGVMEYLEAHPDAAFGGFVSCRVQGDRLVTRVRYRYYGKAP